MLSSIALSRIQSEVRMLRQSPPTGIWATPSSETQLQEIEASIAGPQGSVYEGGIFKLKISIPARYPMEPPHVRFQTPIYHPNIDAEGRVCLDVLVPPPKGAWKPSLNVMSILLICQVLLAEPNPHDGIDAETARQFMEDKVMFDAKAKTWTQRYAMKEDNIGNEAKENSRNSVNLEQKNARATEMECTGEGLESASMPSSSLSRSETKCLDGVLKKKTKRAKLSLQHP